MQKETSPAKLAAFHAVKAQAVVERYEVWAAATHAKTASW
jgi:hypothetical protein